MLIQKILVALLIFTIHIPSSLSKPMDSEDEVLNVIDKMNSAWLEQDSSKCISYFSIDTDFENSFGWSISSRKSLGIFLREFLFSKYPKTDLKYVHTSSTVEFLTPDLVMVDEAKRIDPQDDKSKARFVRSSFLLKLVEGKWLIWKTRSWTPKFHKSPPQEFVLPNKFPDILNR